MRRVRAEIEFSAGAGGATARVNVRLRRHDGRWVAQADVFGGETRVGVGATARAALMAALEPLPEGALRALLADLSLLAPSVRVLQVEAAGV